MMGVVLKSEKGTLVASAAQLVVVVEGSFHSQFEEQPGIVCRDLH